MMFTMGLIICDGKDCRRAQTVGITEKEKDVALRNGWQVVMLNRKITRFLCPDCIQKLSK